MPLNPSIILGGEAAPIKSPAELQMDRFKLKQAQQAVTLNDQAIAKNQTVTDPTEQEYLKSVVQRAGGDPHKIPEILLRDGRLREALDFIKGWPTAKGGDAYTLGPNDIRFGADNQEVARGQGMTAPETRPVAVQTMENGVAGTKYVVPKPDDFYPAVEKPAAADSALPASAKEYEYAKAQGYKGTFEQYQNDDANRKRTVINTGSRAAEPLVAIMGPDGNPVLVPRSQAAGKRPASNREQGRAVTSGDAKALADLTTSLSLLDQLTGQIGTTGVGAKVGAMLPNAVTQLTGWGESAKQRQAIIDQVKQIIGKALEGGVLRKEDEAKYLKILPTIGDPPEVAKSKIRSLGTTLVEKRANMIDALRDAGYDTSRFEARDASSAGQTLKVGAYTVKVK